MANDGHDRMKTLADQKIAVAKLKRLSLLRPALGIVLGTGFHHVVERMAIEAQVACAELPGFPQVGVSGHAGRLLLGRLGGTPVVVLSGRVHYYEGHALDKVTFAVRVLADYGIRSLLLTTAVGGINRRFHAGDLMVITDHINLMGVNPLRGTCPPGRQRFIDLTQTYDAALQARLRQAGRQCGLKLREGVYLALSGPSYETPAEIRAFGRLGADAVGMSTVPEAIVARQCGLRVAGLSCITNLAAGRGDGPLSHADVLETSDRVKLVAAELIERFAAGHADDEAN